MQTRLTVYTTQDKADMLAEFALRLDPDATAEVSTPRTPIPSSPRPTLERGADRPAQCLGTFLLWERWRVWNWYGDDPSDGGWASHIEWRKR